MILLFHVNGDIEVIRKWIAEIAALRPGSLPDVEKHKTKMVNGNCINGPSVKKGSIHFYLFVQILQLVFFFIKIQNMVLKNEQLAGVGEMKSQVSSVT